MVIGYYGKVLATSALTPMPSRKPKPITSAIVRSARHWPICERE
jgi:hypothetical protein